MTGNEWVARRLQHKMGGIQCLTKNGESGGMYFLWITTERKEKEKKGDEQKIINIQEKS